MKHNTDNENTLKTAALYETQPYNHGDSQCKSQFHSLRLWKEMIICLIGMF
jgi:hypothetical protein